jgi:putative flippase GtrA
MSQSLLRRSEKARRLSTYAAGSVVAAACSELTLVLCYGVLDLAPAVSSTIAWLAGAVPNYWLNRSWTWQLRGRPSLTKEVLPYAGIVLATLLLAALVTRGVDASLRDADVSGTTRTVLVAAAFLGVYVIMFLVRYLLLDRLFRRVP